MGFGPMGNAGAPDWEGAEKLESSEITAETLTAGVRGEIVKNLDYIVKSEKDQKKYDKKVEGLLKLALSMREEQGKALYDSLSEDEFRENNEIAQHLIRTKKDRPESDSSEDFEKKMTTSANILTALSNLALVKVPTQEYAAVSELLGLITDRMKEVYPKARCILNSTIIERLGELSEKPLDDETKAGLLLSFMNNTVSKEHRIASLPTRQENPELFQALDRIIALLGEERDGKVAAMNAFNKLAMEVGDLKWRPIEASTENPEAEVTEDEATSAADLFAETIASISDQELAELQIDTEDLKRFFMDSEIDEEEIKELDLGKILAYVAEQSGRIISEVDGKLVILPKS